jgi:hypothetical protein
MTAAAEAISYLLVILRNDLIWLELLLLAGVWLAGGRGAGQWAEGAASRLGRFAARPCAPYVALALAAVLPRLALLIWLPPAEPLVPDEFSHRFLADTLLEGRLSNPTHPLWVHFETIHIFHTPTYSSMYVPGQALLLAAGKLLTGWHWAGVLAGAMLAAASLLWMLRALLPPEWALLGASFYTCRVGMFSAWTEGYWGGHLPAAAGALLLGSAVRLRRAPGTRHALILALAAILLAWTRPFEGLLLCAAAGVWLAAAFVKSEEKGRWVMSVMIPAGLMLGLGAAATCTYFKSVTGSAWKLPYTVNREIYGWPMTLPWQEPGRVGHRHKEHALYFAWEVSEHEKITRAAKIPGAAALKILILFSFYLGPLMAWPLFAKRRERIGIEEKGLLFAAGGAVLAGVLIEQTVYPHYPAPAAGVLYALVAAAWRAAPGRARLLNTALAGVLVLGVAFAGRAAQAPVSRFWQWNSWCDPPRQGEERAAILRQIEAQPGRHVAIVRYNRTRYDRPWVYNAPEIDAQRVVWAQDMGEEGNRELIDYYRDRTVWVVEPDAKPPRAVVWKSR